MEIVYRKLSDLRPNPKNPRKQGPKGVRELADSIKANPKFFEARPILLSDRTGELVIIAGERRSEAAKYLKMAEVPTILLSGLTEAEEDEIMVRDNTHSGVWDRKMLDTWNRKQLQAWGVDKSEFSGGKTDTSEFEKKFGEITNINCDYPIIPVYDEDAEVFIIVSRNQIDSNWLRERLGMNKMKSYKRDEVIKSNVISIEDLKKCL